MNNGYKEYLLYLFGDLTELNVKSESRYWKNNEYSVVLELKKSGNLWVRYTIWDSFSKFFSLQYGETQSVMKDVLEEHLKLGGITPGIAHIFQPVHWKNIQNWGE
jgi:hypothetical protein